MGKNEYTIVYLNQADKIKYSEFLNKEDNFNELNGSLNINDKASGIFDNLLGRITEALVLIEERPVFYINYIKSGNTSIVDRILIDEEYNFSDENYDYIRENIFIERGLLSKTDYFLYTVKYTPVNFHFMSKLGFYVVDSRLIMKFELSGSHRLNTYNKNDDLRIVTVTSEDEMKIRVKVQNEAFDNPKRIPLTLSDVVMQSNDSSYLSDLSLLLMKDNKGIGYGQIVYEHNKYYLVNFGIIPTERGNGYSDFLLIKLLDAALNNGAKEVNLEVYSDNKSAVGLYTKHGFNIEMKKVKWLYKHNK